MKVDLDSAILKVADFPKKGILFYDITGILLQPEAFRFCVKRATEIFSEENIDVIAAVESRGFLFAAPLAVEMGLPLVLLRKPGKLPRETVGRTFTLEYGQDEIHLHKDDIKKGDRVLLVDDLIATGGTLKAAGDLLTEVGANAVEIFAIIGLPFLDYQATLADYKVTTLIEYRDE